VEAGAAFAEEDGPPVPDGTVVVSAVVVEVVSEAEASQEEAVVSAEVEAAAPGKSFKRIDISALGFRV
jgi:hypothetical protein